MNLSPIFSCVPGDENRRRTKRMAYGLLRYVARVCSINWPQGTDISQSKNDNWLCRTLPCLASNECMNEWILMVGMDVDGNSTANGPTGQLTMSCIEEQKKKRRGKNKDRSHIDLALLLNSLCNATISRSEWSYVSIYIYKVCVQILCTDSL